MYCEGALSRVSSFFLRLQKINYGMQQESNVYGVEDLEELECENNMLEELEKNKNYLLLRMYFGNRVCVWLYVQL